MTSHTVRYSMISLCALMMGAAVQASPEGFVADYNTRSMLGLHEKYQEGLRVLCDGGDPLLSGKCKDLQIVGPAGMAGAAADANRWCKEVTAENGDKRRCIKQEFFARLYVIAAQMQRDNRSAE